ncbi:MAG TPA: hypothetical protein VFM70_02840, partial [Salinimicrobium sp.]|nr:hypothetical protein [Salinimicrobium sp.]
MKIITTLFLGVLGFNCFAQLTVKPNGTEDNFIYVKGEVLYVEEEINLTENSDPGVASIYLRHEGQLIQGRTDASANSGTGVLSVFQEGTVDNYAYNYWGAPVGLADG